MQLSLAEVARYVDAQGAASEQPVTGYSIDSRTIVPGQLFFAIRGRRLDGHDYVSQAFARGAVAAVVDLSFGPAPGAPWSSRLLRVADTTGALQRLAQAVRRLWGRKLVAITGSTGKSTTKEMIAALLARRLAVHKSAGNLNNDYGLPLTLLALPSDAEVAVVELAMSGAGEIARLTRIAEPQVGVVTNVAPVHLEFFDSVEAIALAKRELIDNLEADGASVLNADDPRVRAFGERFRGRVVTFGLGKDAMYRAVDWQADEAAGTRFRLIAPDFEIGCRLPLPGRHNLENALAAIATARLFDIPPEELAAALANFKPLALRSEILQFPGGVTVINDCYNSNPRAMEMMLETLAGWPHAGRRIVVAGEMLELGATSPELHRQIGEKITASRVDWLLAVQGNARFFLEGARARGLPDSRAFFFDRPEQAAAFYLERLTGGDVVLVKGSRGVRLETFVTRLQASLGAGAQPVTESRSGG